MVSPNLSMNEDNNANKDIHETTKIEEKDEDKQE
jgi:hypothetical protein